MDIYRATIEAVQDLLRKNTEWKDRYQEYIDEIHKYSMRDSNFNLSTFERAQRQFSVPAPFQLYMPLSTAVNDCSVRRTVFELRFHGQSAANLYVANQKEKTVWLKAKNPKAIQAVLFLANMEKEAETLQKIAGIKLDWHSEEARTFRRIFSQLEDRIQRDPAVKPKGQPEHELESELLQNYAKKASDGKEVCYIQPVTMQGTHARFQMPTPLKASQVKNGTETIEYSRDKGGGIDILARTGRGRSTTLAVLELKDENKASEPPEKVICQALAYATFLRELIRSACGQAWWQFFGFGGSVPKQLVLKAVVVMPYRNKNGIVEQHTRDFIGYIEHENKFISMDGSDDRIELGYIFRDSDASGSPEIKKSF